MTGFAGGGGADAGAMVKDPKAAGGQASILVDAPAEELWTLITDIPAAIAYLEQGHARGKVVVGVA